MPSPPLPVPSLAGHRADAGTVKLTGRDVTGQVTIHATLTGATPQAIRDLLTDPRADHNTPANITTRYHRPRSR